jgi:hypothetical protein
MNILVACEESQAVTIELRKLGHIAYSCDIIECSGGHPEWHIMQDVLPLLNPKNHPLWDGSTTIKGIEFKTCDGKEHFVYDRWDMIIAFPPCTYLTVAGNAYFNVERYGEKALERIEKSKEAAEFFMQFANADCDKIAIENPVGRMNTLYRKPDQIIHPYHFGHPVSKKTCLWLKGLPVLSHTDEVEPEIIHSKGKSGGYSGPSWYVTDENGKILSWKDPRTAKARSKTYSGVAKAMAEQWAGEAK